MDTFSLKQVKPLPLYLVTHQQLAPGYQIAQIAHAVADFAVYSPVEFLDWHSQSQYIVALETQTKDCLERLLQRAQAKHLKTIPFHEPDLDNQLTSVAFVPNQSNKAFLSNLPLAGKGFIHKERKNDE